MKKFSKFILFASICSSILMLSSCDNDATIETNTSDIISTSTVEDNTLTSESTTNTEEETTIEENVNKYVITFVNDDDSILEEKEYKEGEIPSYNATPTKESNNRYYYEFIGWDSEITSVKENKTYKAKYKETYIEYEITFKDYNDEIIEKKNYHYGDKPEIENPTRKPDNRYTYEFIGWDSEITNVTGNMTYKAKYKETYIEYEIIFKDYNDEIIEKKNYHYGDMPGIENPSREDDENFEYIFDGWDTKIKNVESNKTYKAKYRAIYKKSNALIVEYPKNILYVNEYLSYEEISIYKFDENYNYVKIPNVDCFIRLYHEDEEISMGNKLSEVGLYNIKVEYEGSTVIYPIQVVYNYSLRASDAKTSEIKNVLNDDGYYLYSNLEKIFELNDFYFDISGSNSKLIDNNFNENTNDQDLYYSSNGYSCRFEIINGDYFRFVPSTSGSVELIYSLANNANLIINDETISNSIDISSVPMENHNMYSYVLKFEENKEYYIKSSDNILNILKLNISYDEPGRHMKFDSAELVLNKKYYDEFDTSNIDGTLIAYDIYGNSSNVNFEDCHIYIYEESTGESVSGIVKEKGHYIISIFYHGVSIEEDFYIDDVKFVDDPILSINSQNEFTIIGNINKDDAYLYALVSNTELSLTVSDLINNPNTIKSQVDSRNLCIRMKTNNDILLTDSLYYYYAIVDQNTNNFEDVIIYSKHTIISNINNENDFVKMLENENKDDNLIIYKLNTNLDFKDFDWNLSNVVFKDVFNGNNYTVSNISFNKTISNGFNPSIFYSIENASIINVNFDNIRMNVLNSNARRMGIIGAMHGGYLYNIRITNSSFVGYESVGGLVGQVNGGYNLITNCSLVNPIEYFEETEDIKFMDNKNYYEYVYNDDYTYSYNLIDFTLEDSKYKIGDTIPKDYYSNKIYCLSNNYSISAYNKYAGGIIGNYMLSSGESSDSYLLINNCYVYATIGDGFDAGGNIAGIIGRVKNDSNLYHVIINNNLFNGYIISRGLYCAGIVGDFDNGLGSAEIYNNFSLVFFVYRGKELLPTPEFIYANKSLNPIIGRAKVYNHNTYKTYNNIGTFNEYNCYINSLSLQNNLGLNCDTKIEEYPKEFLLEFLRVYLNFDMDNIWMYNDENSKIELR